MEEFFCPFRKKHVALTPEEQVRQSLLQEMVHLQGFPKEAIVIEKSLHQMPHLAFQDLSLPARRADIVCFAKDIHPKYSLYPLLLVECKAVKLNSAGIRQVVGYNHYLKAYYVGIVNAKRRRLGWYDTKTQEYVFISHLPSFQELVESFKP